MFDGCLHLAQAYVSTGLDSEYAAAQDKEVADSDDGTAGDLSKRPDEEQTADGDHSADAEACNGDASLKTSELCVLVRHGFCALLVE